MTRSKRRISIDKRSDFYFIKVNDVECRVSTRELVKHVATIPYDEDKAIIDEVFTNKYYLLHVLMELCFLKSMGYRVGEETFKEVDLEDLWKAHLKALDIELQYALDEGNGDWVLRRLKELEEFIDEPSLPDEIREEIILFLNKWFYLK